MSNGDVGHVQEIIGEIFLDDITLVAAADHEIVDAMRRIDLHDVPENGLAADLDHRLRPEIALLGNASPEPSGEDDDFHGFSRPLPRPPKQWWQTLDIAPRRSGSPCRQLIRTGKIVTDCASGCASGAHATRNFGRILPAVGGRIALVDRAVPELKIALRFFLGKQRNNIADVGQHSGKSLRCRNRSQFRANLFRILRERRSERQPQLAGKAGEHRRGPQIGDDLAPSDREFGKHVRIAHQYGAFEAAQEPVQLVNGRIQTGRHVEIRIAFLAGFRLLPEPEVVEIKQPLDWDEFAVQQIEQAQDLIVKREYGRHRAQEREDTPNHVTALHRIVQHVRPRKLQVTGRAHDGIVGIQVLIVQDCGGPRSLDPVVPGHPGNGSVRSKPLDRGGYRLNGPIEAEIVVGDAKNEFALRQSKNFEIIFKRIAGFREDDLAVVALNMRQHVALLRAAGIVADDDFDVF